MNEKHRVVLNHLLVVLFNDILTIEEKALKNGPYRTLTMNELHVIEAIGLDTASPMNVVATKLNVTVGTLSISINNLVRKGFVERIRGDVDRRVVYIKLTEQGHAAFKHHEAFHEEMIEFTMSLLTLEESDLLTNVLSKLTQYFNLKYSS